MSVSDRDPRSGATEGPRLSPPGAPARGLVAIGDSITRGGGDAMLGLHMQSWALWLAEALGLPFTCLAVNGARVRDALLEQVPRLDGPYDLGCVYLGVNDVRALDWDAVAFATDLDAVLEAIVSHSRAQLLVKLPPAIGRPPAPRTVIAAANDAIEDAARRHGATVVESSSLRGHELVLPDVVHLTARGEAQLALLASARLGEIGIERDERELQEALEPLSLRARLRYAGGAHALAQTRDWRRRVRERAQRAWVQAA
jgi:lysophospholipase L1-like esterase